MAFPIDEPETIQHSAPSTGSEPSSVGVRMSAMPPFPLKKSDGIPASPVEGTPPRPSAVSSLRSTAYPGGALV